MLSIGLMSGTSMDGIDAALIETDGSENLIKELGNISISYNPTFKILLKAAEYSIRKCLGDMNQANLFFSQGILDYLQNELNLQEINVSSQLSELSAYLYGADDVADDAENLTKQISLAEVIKHSTFLHGVAIKKLLNETGYKPHQIDVVGYHGQTMFHRPSMRVSVILGDGQSLADQVGITVVNDFRSRDISFGGQGAPFAPLYHQALAMRDKKIPLAVVNCGGIANITLIRNANELDLIAFDTGPGNGLIDKLIRQRTNGQEQMDTDGKYGKQGKVDHHILKKLYEKCIIKDNKNYFMTIPPKSLDIGDMELIPELSSISIEDACRTLEAFTADSIINSLELINISIPEFSIPKYWILVGGGWNNPMIRQELENRLQHKLGSDVEVFTADEIGWNIQAMEAQIFAYLAVRSLNNQPLSVPGTTGVTEPISGGSAYLPKGLISSF